MLSDWGVVIRLAIRQFAERKQTYIVKYVRKDGTEPVNPFFSVADLHEETLAIVNDRENLNVSYNRIAAIYVPFGVENPNL